MNLLTRFIHFRKQTWSIPGELFGAIQALAEQEGLSPDELLDRVIGQETERRQAGQSLPGRWKTLTSRQQQVVFLTCQNLARQEIAARLGISEDTVKMHQRMAMNKLNLHGISRLKQALQGFDFTPWGKQKPEA